MRVCQLRHFTDGIDQAAVGGHVHEGHETDPVVEQRFEGGDVDLACGVAGDHVDRRAHGSRPLQYGDGVAGVLDLRDQHTVPGPERNGVEEVVPGGGGAVHQGDAVGARPDQPAKGRLHGREVVGPFGGRDVATHVGLPAQVREHGVQDRGRRKRGACAVEEHLVEAARGVPSRLLEVEHVRYLPFAVTGLERTRAGSSKSMPLGRASTAEAL